MNKLILGNIEIDENIEINEDSYLIINLSDITKDIFIRVKENINLKLFMINKNTSNKIKYLLEKNSSVKANHFGVDSSINIDFDLEEDTNLEYNLSIINNSKNSTVENINHLKDNINSKVINHCVNFSKDSFNFYVNSNILKSSNNSNSIQDNKIINMHTGANLIKPNLVIDNYLVDAKHSAYIGSFNDEVYFYLKSRGLSKEKIDKLLIEGFLIGYMKLNEEENSLLNDVLNND